MNWTAIAIGVGVGYLLAPRGNLPTTEARLIPVAVAAIAGFMDGGKSGAALAAAAAFVGTKLAEPPTVTHTGTIVVGV